MMTGVGPERSTLRNVPVIRVAPDWAARSRKNSSKYFRSTMPTNPFSIGISTRRSVGETMRAVLIFANNWLSGMSKSAISLGGIAPPHGLIRSQRSIRATLIPWADRSCAAVAPLGPPPITTTSNILLSCNERGLDGGLFNTGTRHQSGINKQRCFKQKYNSKGMRNINTSGAQNIHKNCARQAANRSRDGLCRTPKAHAGSNAITLPLIGQGHHGPNGRYGKYTIKKPKCHNRDIQRDHRRNKCTGHNQTQGYCRSQ